MAKMVIEIPDDTDMYKICWKHYYGVRKMSAYELSTLCLTIMTGKVLSDNDETNEHIEQISN